MNFYKVSADTVDEMQLDAGMLLSNFDPSDPFAEISDNDIVATTTGGIHIACTPNYFDFGEDVDNIPNNTMEFNHTNGYNCSMAFSTIKFNANNIAWSIGPADITTLTGGAKKITPRRKINTSDYKNIWWVGDKSGGGVAVVCLKNAISTSGLDVQTSKNGKGVNNVTLTGFVSVSNPQVVPMDFYDIPAPEEEETPNPNPEEETNP